MGKTTLLSGIAASAATLVQRDVRWWMMATVRHAAAAAPLGHGSYADALHLRSAPALSGPWRPHAGPDAREVALLEGAVTVVSPAQYRRDELL